MRRHLVNYPLTQLAPGRVARISELHAAEALQHRLAALGFRIGKQILMVRQAAFNGPLHIRIDQTDIIIRRIDAESVNIRADIGAPEVQSAAFAR